MDKDERQTTFEQVGVGWETSSSVQHSDMVGRLPLIRHSTLWCVQLIIYVGSMYVKKGMEF